MIHVDRWMPVAARDFAPRIGPWRGPPAVSSALGGLCVLDLSRLLPGGFCSLLLAKFGADVIKVEDTGAGDYLRASGAPFLALNRGKRSIRVDLKSPDGRDVLLRPARDADVLLESFRPGVMDRLVGYARLREENPRLVHCAITGYGQDGPFATRPGTTPTPRARRAARPHRRARWAAHPGRRPDSRPRRRRADGGVRHPRRPARAGPLG